LRPRSHLGLVLGDDRPSRSGDIPIESGNLRINAGAIQIKSDDRPSRSGDPPIESAAIQIKSDDRPSRSGDIPIKSGDPPIESGDRRCGKPKPGNYGDGLNFIESLTSIDPNLNEIPNLDRSPLPIP
jgi:hypothetical protein